MFYERQSPDGEEARGIVDGGDSGGDFLPILDGLFDLWFRIKGQRLPRRHDVPLAVL